MTIKLCVNSFLDALLICVGKLFHNFEPWYDKERFKKSVLGAIRSRLQACLVLRSDFLVLKRDESNGDMVSG